MERKTRLRIALSLGSLALTFAALEKMEIAMGLRLAASGRVLLNPDRETVWQLVDDDRIIVLAQQIYA